VTERGRPSLRRVGGVARDRDVRVPVPIPDAVLFLCAVRCRCQPSGPNGMELEMPDAQVTITRRDFLGGFAGDLAITGFDRLGRR